MEKVIIVSDIPCPETSNSQSDSSSIRKSIEFTGLSSFGSNSMESIYLSKIASQWSGMMLSKAFLATRNINQKTKAMGLSVSKPVIENRNLSESIQARWVGNA